VRLGDAGGKVVRDKDRRAPAKELKGLDAHDPATGEITLEAELFVAVLGASSYLYAEAIRSQELVRRTISPAGGPVLSARLSASCSARAARSAVRLVE
jgi:hypothetical protein